MIDSAFMNKGRPKFLFCLIVSIFASSCAVYSPKAPLPATVLSTPYISDLSQPMVLANYDAMPEGPAKIARRNQIMWEIIWLTDDSYRTYESAFFSGAAYLNTAGDLISIGLDSVASVTGTAQVKAILAAVGAGLTGARASYQKNFYDQATRETIVQVMRQARLTKLAEIETGMASDASYTIEQGLLDATDYFDAGTVTGALITISEGSATQSAAARTTMRNVRLAIEAVSESPSVKVSALINDYRFQVDYRSLAIYWTYGAPDPGFMKLNVNSTSPAPKTFTVTVPPWMFGSQNGTTPEEIILGVNTDEVPQGTKVLVGNVTLTSSSLPTMSIPVTLTVSK